MNPNPADPQPADWRRVFIAALGVWWVFVTVGIATVTLPSQIVTRLGHGETELGVTVLAFGVATVVSRIAFGPLLGRFSPWRVNLAAASVYAGSLAMSTFASDIVQLVLLRIVAGAAQGVFYLGAATAIARAVPTARLGAALSWLSVALFAGVAVGPSLGDQLRSHGGIELSWLTATCLALVAAACVAPGALRGEGGGATAGTGLRGRGYRWSRTTVWAAGIMTLGTIGYGGFQSLLPLVGPPAGVAQTGPVFAVFAVVSIGVRAGLSPWIDRVDAFRLGTWSAVLTCAGLVVLATVTPFALYAVAVVFAVSLGAQYPALMMLTLAGRPPREHSAIIALYSASFDIGMGLGALVLGVITEHSGFGVACLVAAALGAVGVVLHLMVLPRPDP